MDGYNEAGLYFSCRSEGRFLNVVVGIMNASEVNPLIREIREILVQTGDIIEPQRKGKVSTEKSLNPINSD